MEKTAAVILAAGQGTRMKSKLPKVLHPLGGMPLIQHILITVEELSLQQTIIVVGYGREEVMDTLGSSYTYAVQEEQLGTAHALKQALAFLQPDIENILVLCGDTPLITSSTLRKLSEEHQQQNAAATVLTAFLDDPAAYGRILRDDQGRLLKIIEAKDATVHQRQIKEINSGIYCFKRPLLEKILAKIGKNNVQKEYYLTDAVAILKEDGYNVFAFAVEDEKEILGINTLLELAEAEKILRRRINASWMEKGVILVDPDAIFIDRRAVLGRDTIIHPFCFVCGPSIIEEDCEIGPFVSLSNSKVGEGTKIRYAVIEDSLIGKECKIGPFAYLRPQTRLDKGVKVGDFVEIKNTIVGEGSKVPHLTYLGDATIGKKVNVGAGTITCNYDGKDKWPTVVEDGAFIGSNANLVAPVVVGKKAFVAAGSTITKNVPPRALAIERSSQKNIENYTKEKED